MNTGFTNTGFAAGSLVIALALAAPVQAQHVAADVVVRSGPIAGRVVMSDGYSTYRRAPAVVYRRPVARRVVVVERHAPRVLVVERIGRDHRHHDRSWWKRHGFRVVTVYYLDGRYYNRYDRFRPGMREVVVYERHGRYYRPCEHDESHYWDD